MTESFRFFQWHVVRYVAGHRLLAVLNILAIALGVAVFLAVQIINHSANQAFSAGIDIVAGKAHLEVTAPSGPVDELLYPKLAADPLVEAATPVIQATVALADLPGETLDLVGTDLFTSQPFSTFRYRGQSETTSLDIEEWLGQPYRIAVTQTFADRHHLKLNDTLHVKGNGRNAELKILYLLDLKDAPAGANSRLAAIDLGWAQELLGNAGQVTSIQLRLKNPADAEAAVTALKKLVPPDYVIAAPAQRSRQVEKMLSAFQLNLSALSLISLLAGMFLIYNTCSASVVRRRLEVGILRALGVTRKHLFLLFLGEALLMGILGTMLGILSGIGLAAGLLKSVSATISSLYVSLAIEQLQISPFTVTVAIAVGLSSVLLAAFQPALEATRVMPVETLAPGFVAERARRPPHVWLFSAAASLLAGAGAGVLAFQTQPWFGFASAFFVLIGFALFMPLFAAGCAGTIHLLRRQLPVLVVLAAQYLVRGIHRSAVTAAALMATIAMTVGITIMTWSFRQTMELWVNHMVQADLFVTASTSATPGNRQFLSDEMIETLRTDPAIDTLEVFREVPVPFRGETVPLSVLSGTRNRQLRFLHGNDAEIREQFAEPGHVVVSESFARRHKVKTGEPLELATPSGVTSFKVAGVFFDYSRDQGTIAMPRQTYLQYWRDTSVHSAALFLRQPASLDELESRLRRQFPEAEVTFFSNRALRTRIFEIFDQTFSVTYILRTISLIVAVLGIFLAFTIAVTERERELALIRAIGASPLQLQLLVMTECGLVALIAGLAGLLGGLVLACVLTYVINPAFFGWSIHLWIPWGSILLTVLSMIPAALIAGLLPALSAGRVNLAEALRSE